MIDKLTPEQQKLMSVVKDEWIDFALNSKEPMHTRAAKQGIEWVYKLAKLPRPEIVYAKSPIACQIIGNILKNPSARKSIRKNVQKSVWDSVQESVGDSVENSVGASVRDSVWASVRDSVENSVWDSVWASVGASVGASVRDSVWASVGASVGASVRDSVENSVGASVRDSVWGYIYPGWREVLSDAGWVAFFDYFTRIGAVNHKLFNRYLKYMKSGVFYGAFLDGAAIVCGRPKYINRDIEGRLHADSNPAILWEDGWPMYFWHGIEVSQKLIETPEKITKEDIIREKNAEKRRAMSEKLEDTRFAELLDLEVINEEKKKYLTSDFKEKVQTYRLHRTREIDDLVGEYILFIEKACTSTGRQYMEIVPPNIKTALEAVAWQEDIPEAEFRELVMVET